MMKISSGRILGGAFALSLALIACGGATETKPQTPASAASATAAPPAAPPASATAEATPAPVADAGAAAATAPAEDEKSQIEVVTPGSAPRKPLRYVFHADRKDSLVTEMRMTLTLTLDDAAAPAVKMPLVRTTMTIVPEKIADNGDLIVRYKATASDVIATPKDPPELVSALKPKMQSLVGLSGEYEVTTRGEAVRTTLDVPSTVDPGVRDVLEQLRSSMRELVVPFPSDALGVGAQWKVTTRLPLGGFVANRAATYTLTRSSGNEIAFDVAITLSAPAQMIEAQGLPVGATLMLQSFAGSGKGKVKVSLDELVPHSDGSLDSTAKIVVTQGATVKHMQTATQIEMKIAPAGK